MVLILKMITMLGRFDRNTMVIHLGANPRNGGSPLMDKIMIEKFRDRFVLEVRYLFCVGEFILWCISINNGIAISEYRIR